jgi:hypothetical protein
MPRYLMEWELDTTKVPVDPKERANAFLPMIQMIKQDIQNGDIKEWGVYLGEMRGFAVTEGSEEKLAMNAQKYAPIVQFTTHPAITIDQLEKTFKEMSK